MTKRQEIEKEIVFLEILRDREEVYVKVDKEALTKQIAYLNDQLYLLTIGNADDLNTVQYH